MNVRILGEDSPEGRLAAVAVGLVERLKRLAGRDPDYADFRDEFRTFVELEILLARLEEARIPSAERGARVRAILRCLAELKLDE